MQTEHEALVSLREWVGQSRTQVEAAKALEISPQYLSDVLHGKRDPARVLRRIGYERLVHYRLAS